MKARLTIALLFFFILNLNAQDSLRVNNYYTEGELTLGYRYCDFSPINSFLTDNGLSPISHNRFNIGGSSIAIRNKFVFGTSFDVLAPTSESQPGNRETRLQGYSYGALLGYIVFQKRNITIQPYITLYSNRLSLKIIDNQYVADAGSLLNVTTRNVSMDYTIGSLDFGLNVNKKFARKNKYWDCPQSNRYNAVGLKVGYFFTVDQNDCGTIGIYNIGSGRCKTGRY